MNTMSPAKPARDRSVPRTAWAVAASALAVFGLVWGSGANPRARNAPAATLDSDVAHPGHAADSKLVARGEYLVTILGCSDCHTPFVFGPNGPEPDMTRMLSGHPESLIMPPPPKLPDGPWVAVMAASNTAYAGPWGISYATNLTPDENTGMGIWTQEMFIAALRTGKHFGVSRDILPPMPWQGYGRMTDDDLGAVFAYLRSVRPIHNRVPEAVLAESAQ